MERWRRKLVHAARLRTFVVNLDEKWKLRRWRDKAQFRKHGMLFRTQRRLVRGALKKWRRFCTLPSRYDRLLEPLRRRSPGRQQRPMSNALVKYTGGGAVTQRRGGHPSSADKPPWVPAR